MHPGHCLAVISAVLFAGCLEPERFSYDGFEEAVHVLAGGLPSCDECVRVKCSREIGACARTAGCVGLTRCIYDSAYPTAAMDCSGGEAASRGGAEAGELFACFEACGEECALGNEWQCVRNYQAEVVHREVRLGQWLFDQQTGKPLAGVRVEFCGDVRDALHPSSSESLSDAGAPETSCDTLVPVTANASGYYEITLPVEPFRPGYVGWRGVRRVSGETEDGIPILTQALIRNVPIWADTIERTGLLTRGAAESYLEQLRLLPGVAVAAVQLFDCRGYPAVSARLRSRDSSIVVMYPQVATAGSFLLQSDPSRLTAGLALVLSVGQAEQEYALEAHVGETVVATIEGIDFAVIPTEGWESTVFPVLSLHPNPTAQR